MDSDRFQNSDKMCPDLEPVNGEIIYFQAAVASGAGSRAAGCGPSRAILVQNLCAKSVCGGWWLGTERGDNGALAG